MDYASMTIDQLEAEVVRIEGEVSKLRANQLVAHDAAETKRKSVPVVPTPHDQVMTPGVGQDLLAWAKSLPQAAIDAINSLKGKE
jgi:hypothetical protein